MLFQYLDLCIGEVVVVEICDLLEKLKTTFCYSVSPHCPQSPLRITVVKQQGWHAPGCDLFLAKTVEHQLQERVFIFVTPNVDDIDTFWILHGHCGYGRAE